jgi:hypothetical protein
MSFLKIFIKLACIALVFSFQLSPSLSLQIQNSSPADQEHAISTAITDVIRKFYLANDIRFDFLVYGETSRHINDVLNGVLRKLSQDNVSIGTEHIKYVKRWNHKFIQSSVIFVKSEKYLHNLHKISSENQFNVKLTNMEPQQFKFLVYVEEIKLLQLLNDSISKTNDYHAAYPPDLRSFEFFITSDGLKINLTARVLYSEDICGVFTLKILNELDINSQQWSKHLKNFDHFSSFHGCLLTLGVKMSHSFYIKNVGLGDFEHHEKIQRGEDTEFEGLANELVEVMARRCDFSFHYTILFISSNGVGISNTKSYYVPSTQIISFDHGMLDRKDYSVHSTIPFESFDDYYLVTPNHLYTNYEKLLFPFDAATWALLLFTIGLTFGTIYGLRFCPHWIQTKILGKGENKLSKFITQ